MYRKILIPLDKSALAERVLAHLHLFATPGESEILLVHALQLTQVGTDAYIAARLLNATRQEAIQYIADKAEALHAQGFHVQTQVWSGHPPLVIDRIASEGEVDLIAMSTHGRTGVARWALGSVADAVVRHALWPVLLVRTNEEPINAALRRIFVPLDGSALAESALPHAKQLARRTGAELLLMRAVPPLAINQWAALLDDEAIVAQILEGHAVDAETYLTEIARGLRDEGLCARMLLLHNEAAEAIVQSAAAEGADLIAMATHGRGGLARWMHGSVASRVLGATHCPLLLVRGAQVVESPRPIQQITGLSPAPSQA